MSKNQGKSNKTHFQSFQDWEPVIVRKPAPKSSAEAKKRGYKVTTKKKDTSNKLYKNDSNLKNLEDDVVVPKKISFNVKITIQKARAANKMTQAQLAQRLNLPLNMIKNYESGKAIPNNNILNRMGRVLNIHLTGKNIGKPFKT